MNTVPGPQCPAAAILLELLVEHPELPLLRWVVPPDGTLTGVLDDTAADVLGLASGRPAPEDVARAYQAAIGGDVGTGRSGVRLRTAWRGMGIHLALTSPALAEWLEPPALGAVPAPLRAAP